MSVETGEINYSVIDVLLGRHFQSASLLAAEISSFFEAKIELARTRAGEFFGPDAWEAVMAQTGILDLGKRVQAQLACLGLGNIHAPIVAGGNLEVERFIATQFMTENKPILRAREGEIETTILPTERTDLYICLMQDGDSCFSLVGVNSVCLPDCL